MVVIFSPATTMKSDYPYLMKALNLI